jgi:hypothetical protein
MSCSVKLIKYIAVFSASFQDSPDTFYEHSGALLRQGIFGFS